MNAFVIEIWDDEAGRCAFYTVRWEDAVQNETDKFFNKYNSGEQGFASEMAGSLHVCTADRRSIKRSKVARRIQEETPEEVRIFVRQYTDIVVRINQLMQARGYTQKQLAEKMNKKPSEINKWLKGNHNLTLKTLAKLEAELGEPIIFTSAEQMRKNQRKQIA